MTPEIRQFVKMRYREQCQAGVGNYRQLIRAELLSHLDVDVSGETLRRLFREADEEDRASAENEWAARSADDLSQPVEEEAVVGIGQDNGLVAEDEGSFSGADDVTDEAVSSQTTSLLLKDRKGTDASIEKSPKPQVDCEGVSVNDRAMRNYGAGNGELAALPILPTSGCRVPAIPTRFHHMGLFLFLPMLHRIGEGLGSERAACLQLLAQLLLGAKNVEQGKLLSARALSFMVGPIMKYEQGLRVKLDSYASRQGIKNLVRENLILLGLLDALSLIIYYDPHSKHYTGELPILKGWCGNLKDTAKVLYGDYIHSEQGFPLFMKHYDNFYDLRERITFTLYEFATFFHVTPEMTIIVDRGIYGLDTMRLFTGRQCKLITWEKGYDKKGWDAQGSSHTFTWQRPRNNSDDLRTYTFEYQETLWHTDPLYRRIIVRATNPKGRTIEVSILSSNQTLTAERIIKLIFNRWIQENDFRYLIKHLGIDELDTRAAKAYTTTTAVNDRQVKSRTYRRLQKERDKVTNTLKNLLHSRAQKLKTLIASQERQITNSLASLGELSSQLRQIPHDQLPTKAADKLFKKVTRKIDRHNDLIAKHKKKYLAREQELTEQIHKTHQLQADIKHQLNAQTKTESRLAALIDEDYKYFDTTRKSVMDMCRILARNIFYQTMSEFRPIYRNHRDDHDIMRTLTESSGNIIATSTGIT
ncbi:MAG: hypothetical protein JRF33_27570, partial [Deltaproteobacteria bacterium]|nr:hypothetical protein [Deltaproteobacteria bacterium]